MAADSSTRAVVTALAANLGIAAAKFVAGSVTGSASMVAEGVHSVADSANQLLLLLGGRRARQAPSALHPFGYARVRYVYAFLVAIVLFSLGGLFANMHGESHPALWYLLLYPLTRLTTDPRAMQVLNLVVATGAVAGIGYAFARFARRRFAKPV